MVILLTVLNIIFFSLIFYRLITTNTWTTGKKLLVGLVGGVILDTSMDLMVLLHFFPLELWALSLIHLPLTVVGSVMVYLMYKRLF